MKWTRKAPTKPGWYWQFIKTLRRDEQPEITQVVRMDDGKCYEIRANRLREVVESTRHFYIYWAGPLRMPEVPEWEEEKKNAE